MKKLIVILLGISMLTSCQLFTRKFGGNTTITLEKGEKLTAESLIYATMLSSANDAAAALAYEIPAAHTGSWCCSPQALYSLVATFSPS